MDHVLRITASPPSDGQAECSCGKWALLSLTMADDTRDGFVNNAKEQHARHLASVARQQARENNSRIPG